MPEPLRPATGPLVAGDFESEVLEVMTARAGPPWLCMISAVVAATMPTTSTRIPSRARADHGATAAC